MQRGKIMTNIYTIKISAEIEVFADSVDEALEKASMQLLEDVAENAELSISSAREDN